MAILFKPSLQYITMDRFMCIPEKENHAIKIA